MEKLTKSMSLFKERNCSVSIVLDSRTRRKNAYEFPLSLRFTVDRKFFYFTVGSSFTERKFSDISSMKSKTATIFVSGNECLFLSTSFFLALLHGGSVPIIVGTMNNYVNFLFEIKTQPGVLLRPKR